MTRNVPRRIKCDQDIFAVDFFIEIICCQFNWWGGQVFFRIGCTKCGQRNYHQYIQRPHDWIFLNFKESLDFYSVKKIKKEQKTRYTIVPAQNNVVSLRSFYTGKMTWREYICRDSASNANTKANICLSPKERAGHIHSYRWLMCQTAQERHHSEIWLYNNMETVRAISQFIVETYLLSLRSSG